MTRKTGRLCEIEKRFCKKNGFRALYLTTDSYKALKISRTHKTS